MKTFLVKGLVCKDEPVRKLFIFETTSLIMKTFLLKGLVRKA